VLAAALQLHLRLLAAAPDTLIARKLGADAAARVSDGARDVIAGRQALPDFDASLREPRNALNPGTTADLVTATLFVALVEGML
jgi:triphosphoribosyl-dephospho-CoA synthase